MSGWTDEDYRRLGMTPPGKGRAAVAKPAMPVPKRDLGGRLMVPTKDAIKDALARRLKESGA